MSLNITHKYSTEAGTPPTSGDIGLGEIAINTSDAELYTKDNAGNIKEFKNSEQVTAEITAATTEAITAATTFTQTGTGAVQRTVESKLQDVVSVLDFIPVAEHAAIRAGTSTYNCTAAIQAAINSGASTLLIPNGTYLVTTETVNANLIGGGSIVNSSKTIYDGSTSEVIDKLALSNYREAQVIAQGLKGSFKTSIYKIEDVYIVNRHLGGDNWLETTLTNSGQISGQDTAWKVTQQKVYESVGWLTAKDAVEGGTWLTYNSGTDTYVGHQLKQSNTVGNTLTWTDTFSGDLALCFTGDTDGGIVEVTINGGSPIDVDTYSATALNHRQVVTVAKNLPSSNYTVVVTSTNRKNPLSAGYQANITGLKISNGSVAPYSNLFQAKPWRPNTTARAYEEVQGPTGAYYYTTAGGTTGTTPPTHTSGTVSDGGVNWAITTSTSFSEKNFLIQATGSELEYAYEVIPSGQSTSQDIGGNLHGGEVVIEPVQVIVDANLVQLSEEFAVGDHITIKQKILDYYGDYGTKIDVANVVQIHEFDADSMRIKYDMNFVTDASVGYFYACMWPFLTYSSIGYRKQFATMATPSYSINLADYESNATNPLVGRFKDLWMEANGRAYVEAGSAGIPTADNGSIGIILGLKADINGVDFFNNPTVRASMAANSNNGQYTGTSSWLSKMYFMRAAASDRESIQAGQTISNLATYYVKLTDNNIDLSTL